MRDWLRVVGAILLSSVLGVIVTVLVVWVYSTFLSPGRPIAAYQDFAQSAGPVVSVVAGPPIMFLVARWLVRRLGAEDAKKQAIRFMAGYALLDLAVLVGAGAASQVWGFAALSLILRAAAVAVAVRRQALMQPAG